MDETVHAFFCLKEKTRKSMHRTVAAGMQLIRPLTEDTGARRKTTAKDFQQRNRRNKRKNCIENRIMGTLKMQETLSKDQHCHSRSWPGASGASRSSRHRLRPYPYILFIL